MTVDEILEMLKSAIKEVDTAREAYSKAHLIFASEEAKFTRARDRVARYQEELEKRIREDQ